MDKEMVGFILIAGTESQIYVGSQVRELQFCEEEPGF